MTEEEALQRIFHARHLEFAPGERFRYNDSGYVLLSLVIRRTSARSLREFAAESLFRPLGMAHTRIREDHTEVIPRRAEGYAPRDGGGFRVCASNWEATGDGAVHTTIEDLSLWNHNFYDAHIVGSELPNRMQTPGRLDDGAPIDYGMGLYVGEHRGEKACWHEGEWAGFRAEYIRLPGHGVAAAVLCNRSDADAPRLARKLLGAALEEG